MIRFYENTEDGRQEAMEVFKEYGWDQGESDQYWNMESRKADKTQRYIDQLRKASKEGLSAFATACIEAQQRAYGWKEEEQLSDAIDLLEGTADAEVAIEL